LLNHFGSPQAPPSQAALATINPSYAALLITQKPSWVRAPTSYSSGAVSSLSVAFEDTDGSILRALLAEHYLYAFGNRATVKKWKYRQANHKDTSDNTATKHPEGGDHTDEEDVETYLISLTSWLRPQQQQQQAEVGNSIRKDTSDDAATKHSEGGDHTEEEDVETSLIPLRSRMRKQQQHAEEGNPVTNPGPPAADSPFRLPGSSKAPALTRSNPPRRAKGKKAHGQ
jgi:hypothetical protein